MDKIEISQQIIDSMQHLNELGINQGVSGNISVRYQNSMIITPTGIAYDKMKPCDLSVMPLDDDSGVWFGKYKPSSEWRIHHRILNEHPELFSVVHTHPTFCTVLSMARKAIPACHYMIATFGGDNVRCSGYETYGTKALADKVIVALKDRMACLMANHGAITLGETLDKATWRMIELETIAKQYYFSLMLSDIELLSASDVSDVFRQLSESSYGLKEKKEHEV